MHESAAGDDVLRGQQAGWPDVEIGMAWACVLYAVVHSHEDHFLYVLQRTEKVVLTAHYSAQRCHRRQNLVYVQFRCPDDTTARCTPFIGTQPRPTSRKKYDYYSIGFE